jgi:hypothetical protein
MLILLNISRFHEIDLTSASDHKFVNEELKNLIVQLWREVHYERRGPADRNLADRLASHDSEIYLHVLSSRIDQMGRTPLGYTDWWLTLDTKARGVFRSIDKKLLSGLKIGPVMSIDYLIRYLAFGPRRDKVNTTDIALAKIYSDTIAELIPPQMIDLVIELRKTHAKLPEYLVQRRIRDALNNERSRAGRIDSGGLTNAADNLDSSY